jgi:hypothetical protein
MFLIRMHSCKILSTLTTKPSRLLHIIIQQRLTVVSLALQFSIVVSIIVIIRFEILLTRHWTGRIHLIHALVLHNTILRFVSSIKYLSGYKLNQFSIKSLIDFNQFFILQSKSFVILSITITRMNFNSGINHLLFWIPKSKLLLF